LLLRSLQWHVTRDEVHQETDFAPGCGEHQHGHVLFAVCRSHRMCLLQQLDPCRPAVHDSLEDIVHVVGWLVFGVVAAVDQPAA
jgi:hypothetical protein